MTLYKTVQKGTKKITKAVAARPIKKVAKIAITSKVVKQKIKAVKKTIDKNKEKWFFIYAILSILGIIINDLYIDFSDPYEKYGIKDKLYAV